MIGAFTRRLHGYDDAHIARQIAHRKPDLLVLNYGGNDLRRLVGNSVTAERYKAEYTEAIRKLRAADHDMPCLVVSVIDHARSGKREVEPHHVERMVTAQREVAFAQGCGFFDSVAAMGGPGSIREWLKKSPRLAEPDLKHLNARGRDVMGEIIYSALMAGYSHYRARHAAIAQGRTR
jgi:lysophospholipase L1-like esterase